MSRDRHEADAAPIADASASRQRFVAPGKPLPVDITVRQRLANDPPGSDGLVWRDASSRRLIHLPFRVARHGISSSAAELLPSCASEETVRRIETRCLPLLGASQVGRSLTAEAR